MIVIIGLSPEGNDPLTAKLNQLLGGQTAVFAKLANIEQKVEYIMSKVDDQIAILTGFADEVVEALAGLDEARQAAADREAAAQKVIDDDAVTDAEQIAAAEAVLDDSISTKLGAVSEKLRGALAKPEVPVEPPVDPVTPSEPTDPSTEVPAETPADGTVTDGDAGNL